ncbi:aspartate carbamoyltransferase [Tissierella creatinini]|nr:aspartate carbamoyltransferase [Tissierella creatinini]TJX67249.1 aspartate carbamoyltransferase [Soehngenia saccharolytica]
MLKGRNLIDPSDLSMEEIDEIMGLTREIVNNPKEFAHVCDGMLLGSLFYEPSTRTRLSFEAAMLRLGGKVVGFSEPGSSSVQKGESLNDTLRTVGAYTDIIVMRHPKEGAPKLGADLCPVPLINAGDGGHQHPTQTLTDLYTILESKGSLDNLVLGFCGDLQFGRTVHSLIKAMSRYKNVKFVLISPVELEVPEYIKTEILDKNEVEYIEVERLEDVIDTLDILYMTRVQKERFFNEVDYIRLKDSYILDLKKLEKAKKDLAILHPLPRVNEIKVEVDSDPRAKYFKQVKNGMFVRMALIAKLLGVK